MDPELYQQIIMFSALEFFLIAIILGIIRWRIGKKLIFRLISMMIIITAATSTAITYYYVFDQNPTTLAIMMICIVLMIIGFSINMKKTISNGLEQIDVNTKSVVNKNLNVPDRKSVV